MGLLHTFTFLILLTVCIGSVTYLLKTLKKERQLLSLVGLFCLGMGFLLLVLDMVLITFTHGPQYITDYLLFNRLVSDTGFAGRWVLTVYLFISTGICISFYILVKSLIKKFNK
ncbi:MAG: hypothetical protein JSW69_06740 [Deltaproteobacteria bacterium]|jgi:hypothetical protein|nr:MAG: hypothetical protein JSW69_06740 [Deltaproteobacteria bacterium]